MRILSIDPGLNSGFCVVDYNAESDKFNIVEDGVYMDFMPAVDAFLLKYIKYAVEYVVIEDFKLLPHMQMSVAARDPNLTAVLIKGALVAMLPTNKLFLNMPSMKTAVADEDLKAAGLWWVDNRAVPSDKYTHVRDAKRHAVLLARSLASKEKTNATTGK